MESVAVVLKGAFGLVIGVVGAAIGLMFPLGGLYWMWIAIQVGSFWMFVVGMIPPAWPVTCIVGVYSLAFGVPHWVFNWFGH